MCDTIPYKCSTLAGKHDWNVRNLIFLSLSLSLPRTANQFATRLITAALGLAVLAQVSNGWSVVFDVLCSQYICTHHYGTTITATTTTTTTTTTTISHHYYTAVLLRITSIITTAILINIHIIIIIITSSVISHHHHHHHPVGEVAVNIKSMVLSHVNLLHSVAIKVISPVTSRHTRLRQTEDFGVIVVRGHLVHHLQVAVLVLHQDHLSAVWRGASGRAHR